MASTFGLSESTLLEFEQDIPKRIDHNLLHIVTGVSFRQSYQGENGLRARSVQHRILGRNQPKVNQRAFPIGRYGMTIVPN